MVRFLLRTLTPRPHLVARTAGGERECLRFSKQLALLAYLGARPDGAASREELVSLLWDGSAQRDARHALRQVIHQIRRHAEAELVHGDGALCVRREELEFDVVRFRQELAAGRLEDALALYETDFLSTVTVPNAPEFERWADDLRRQLAAERGELLRTLLARAADEGRWAQAARYARTLIEQDPADPEPRLRLVELLALSGDTVDARIEAERVRDLPEADERAIARALAAGAGATAGHPASPGAGLPEHPPLVGRTGEFAHVVERWKAAAAGTGGAVLLAGEPGSGKTRLLAELAPRLRQDRGLVLAARCYPVEAGEPLAPFVELLAAAHAAPGLAGAAPGSLATLAGVIPEIAARFPGAAPPATPVHPAVLAAALLEGLLAIADEQPVALLLDDAHHASPAALGFAHRLARRVAHRPLLLVLAARDAVRAPRQTRAMRDLAASDAVETIPLPPLDAADVVQLLGALARLPQEAAGAALAARVVEHTGGVPAHVLALLRDLSGEGRLAIRDGAWAITQGLTDRRTPLPAARSRTSVARARLEALDPPSRALLAALAVWQRAATAQELALLADQPEDAVWEGLAVLARRRLLAHSAEGSYAAPRDATGEVARAVVSPVVLAELHRNAATLAELRAPQDPVREWFVAARHAAAAGDMERAAGDAVHGAGAIEARSGKSAAWKELYTWLDALPEPLKPDIAARLPQALREDTAAPGKGESAA